MSACFKQPGLVSAPPGKPPTPPRPSTPPPRPVGNDILAPGHQPPPPPPPKTKPNSLVSPVMDLTCKLEVTYEPSPSLKQDSELMYAPDSDASDCEHSDPLVPPRPRSPPPPPPPNHEGEVGGHEPPPAPITPPPGSPKCQGASTLVPYETMPKACYDATLLLNQAPAPTSGRVHANSSGSWEDNRPTPGRPNPPVVPPPPPPSKRGLRLLPHALGSGGGGPPIPGRPNQPVVGVPPKGSNRSGQLNVFLDEFARHFSSPTPAFKSFAVKDPGFTIIHNSANWVAVG